jgi:hypothetical protein
MNQKPNTENRTPFGQWWILVVVVLVSVTALQAQPLRFESQDSVAGKPKYEFVTRLFLKLNGFYDVYGGIGRNETFNVSNINVYSNESDPIFWMDMHQSQIRLKGTVNTEDLGPVVAYVEGDFWAGSLRFRLRHAWIDFYGFHIGQDWSTFGDKNIWPNVFDWDGPPSGVWIRHPMVKYTNVLGSDHLQYELCIEAPVEDYTTSPLLDTAVNPAPQSVPDGIATLRWVDTWGHIRLATIARSLKYKQTETDGSISDANAIGYGAALSGKAMIGELSSLQWQAAVGQGIGAYLVSYGGKNYDAIPDGQGALEPLPTAGGWIAYEHYFTPKWHMNIIGGGTTFTGTYTGSITHDPSGNVLTDPDLTEASMYILTNLMFDPIPNLNIGVEFNWGERWVTQKGTIDGVADSEETFRRSAQRISFGFMYFFN